MPQMAPMSWTLLFLFFTTSLIFFNTMNYYSNITQIKDQAKQMNNKINSKPWKW